MNKKMLLALGALCLLANYGCTPKLGNVQAEEGRPESAEVQQISIPYEPGYPKVVLAVEPFRSSSTVISYTNGPQGQVPIGDSMAAQLRTALSNDANFSLVDDEEMKGNKFKMQKGEVGPFVLRATLTEFSEVAEAEAESTNVSLGGVGAVMGIAGAVADKPGLMWTGAGLAAANPSYEDSTAARKGMVAFDVQIVDKRTGRIVRSFSSSGTFKAESAVNGMSLFGIGKSKAKFAQSALGQALRVAMNDAVRKTHDALRGVR
ncbi:MAG: hypothetical protein GYA55_01985 [SAR324 cluster bacterium]|uniref:Curli production assembly/transport component CsgG n=1 Tax=SAR324 cluster bacterium TaxID=2024889 RepID=A0A7X9IIC6_9DELT|nr:hypothetical protein [SAR324 cluster bacterium]